MLSAWLMYRRFAQALKVASRNEGFVQILGAAVLVRQLGFAYVEVRREEKAAKQAKADAEHPASTPGA